MYILQTVGVPVEGHITDTEVLAKTYLWTAANGTQQPLPRIFFNCKLLSYQAMVRSILGNTS